MAKTFSPTERMRLARKTSSIDQLSKQFRQQVAALTGEQEKAFTSYQAGVAEKMAPFESALSQYQTKDFPAYEAAAAGYQQRLDAYAAALRDIQANPTETVQAISARPAGRIGFVYQFPGGISGSASDLSRQGYELAGQGPSATITRERTAPAKFTEAAPTAPTAPTRPEIAAFSDEPFQARRAKLEQGLQRELGERRSARLTAVSRRGRSMLSGA
jgi:hypothetical protein